MIKSKVTFATCFTCMKSAKFLIFKFPKVMREHTYGVMDKIIWVLLEICRCLQQQKNLANPSRIDKVIAVVKVAHFFDSPCRNASYCKALIN